MAFAFFKSREERTPNAEAKATADPPPHGTSAGRRAKLKLDGREFGSPPARFWDPLLGRLEPGFLDRGPDLAKPPDRLLGTRRRRLPPGADPALTGRARDLALQLGLPRLAESVVVCWNGRLQTTAGLAFFAASLIQLNPKLRELGEREVDRTLRHELAHLVAHVRHLRRRIQPHGEEWKQACRDLGIGDEARCHSLPLAGRTVRRRFAYQCPGCKSILLRVRKFSRFTACYPCCRKHNRGRYHSRFRLAPISMDDAQRLLKRRKLPQDGDEQDRRAN